MKGVSASERTVRSACFPTTIEPRDASTPERTGAAERGELERVRRGQSVGPALARSRAHDRRAHLVEHVERRCRGGAVGGDADADAGLAQRSEWRHPAAEDAVRARAVGDGDVVGREDLDLLLVGLDAVRGDDVRVEQPRLRERPDAGRARWRNEHVRERLPAAATGAEELRLVVTLGEMRGDGKAELEPMLGRDRSCRCTARGARLPAARRPRVRRRCAPASARNARGSESPSGRRPRGRSFP